MTQVPKDEQSQFRYVEYWLEYKSANDACSIPISVDSIYYCVTKWSIFDVCAVGTVYIADYLQILEVIPPNIPIYFTYEAEDINSIKQKQSFLVTKIEKSILDQSKSYLRLDYVDQYFNYFSGLYKSKGYATFDLKQILTDYHTDDTASKFIIDNKDLVVISNFTNEIEYVVPSCVNFVSTLYNLELHSQRIYTHRREDICVTDIDSIDNDLVQISKVGGAYMLFTNNSTIKEYQNRLFALSMVVADKETNSVALGTTDVCSFEISTKTIKTQNILPTDLLSDSSKYVATRNENLKSTTKLIEIPVKNIDTPEFIYKVNMRHNLKFQVEVRGTFLLEPLKKIHLDLVPANYADKDSKMKYYTGDYYILSVEDVFEQNTFAQRLILGRDYIEKPISGDSSSNGGKQDLSSQTVTEDVPNQYSIGQTSNVCSNSFNF